MSIKQASQMVLSARFFVGFSRLFWLLTHFKEAEFGLFQLTQWLI